MSDKIKIYGELENHTENGFVTDARQIKGHISGGEEKSQSWINIDLYNKVGQFGSNTAYTVCNTASDVADKEITLNNFELTTSVRILIGMTNENTANNVKLVVNNDDPCPLIYNGHPASEENSWGSGEVLDVYYNGSSFISTTYGSAQFRTGERVIDLGIDNSITANSNNLITSGAVSNKVTQIDNTLTELDNAVFPLTVSLENTIPSNSIQEYTGSNVPVNINWSTSKRGKGNVVANILVIKKNGSTISTLNPPVASTGSLSENINTLGSTIFSVTANLNGVEVTEEKTYIQCLPSYIGFYVGGYTVEEMRTGTGKLSKRVISDVEDLSGGPYINDKGVAAYFTICVPASFIVSSVMDAKTGFEIPMQNAFPDNSVEIGGESRNYSIYRSADPINAGSSINVTIY